MSFLNNLRYTLYKIIRHRYFIPVCFTAAVLIRIIWIYAIDAQPVSDFRWYYERGIDFAAGRGYSVGPNAYWPYNMPPAALIPEEKYPINGRPTAFWPVGYPLFLGLLFTIFGSSVFIAKIANVIFYMGVLFFSYYIAKTLFDSELSGRITLLILSFYPTHIVFTSLLSTEILFLFLLLLGITLLIVPKHRLWLAFVSGVVFGLACLVKPQAFLIPAVFFTASLVSNIKGRVLLEHMKSGLVVYFALVITILPWFIRNYRVFNDFVFVSNNGGYNLLVGNNPYATGGYVFNNKIVAMLSHVQDEHKRDREAFKLATAYIVDHPLETIKLWPSKLWYLYRKDVAGIWQNADGMQSTMFRPGTMLFLGLEKLTQFYYLLIGVMFLSSLLFLFFEPKLKKRSQTVSTLGLWIVVYFTFIYLLTFGGGRFHFPMIPWFAMYIGLFIERLLRPKHQVVTTRSNAAWQVR